MKIMPQKTCEVFKLRTRFDAKSPKELRKWYNQAFSKGDLKSDIKFYHQMLDHLNVPYNNKLRLLDIACGNGYFLKEAEKRVRCFGVDISDVAIAKAKKIAAKSDVRRGEAESLPYKDNYFDYITCIGSLEHFIKMEKALSEMRRVLKNGGLANILVPNSEYLIFEFKSPEHCQINERMMSLEEWTDIIKEYFVIRNVKKYNTRWYLKWIPLKYCCHFAFICMQSKVAKQR